MSNKKSEATMSIGCVNFVKSELTFMPSKRTTLRKWPLGRGRSSRQTRRFSRGTGHRDRRRPRPKAPQPTTVTRTGGLTLHAAR
jgi:hypothetical protein